MSDGMGAIARSMKAYLAEGWLEKPRKAGAVTDAGVDESHPFWTTWIKEGDTVPMPADNIELARWGLECIRREKESTDD